MIFPYVDRGYGFMPIIPVTLMKGGCFITVEALVDSGAGRSVFDAELAETLGIPRVEDGLAQTFEGVTGHRLTGYCHDITLIVGGSHFHDITVTFSYDMPDNAVNILGQEDFFDLFPIKFTHRKRELEFMSNSRSSLPR